MTTPGDSKPVKLEISHRDDPRVLDEAATEDYSLHVVPPTWRMPRGSLMMGWWAFVSAIAYLVIGATAALAVGTVEATIGMLLAVIAYGAINYVITRHASENGLTAAMFSRSMLGYVGAVLVPLVLAATVLYYFVFEASIIGVALEQYIGGLPLDVWYLIVVLYSIPLVLRGVRVWLDKFNGFLLPFYAIGLTAAIVWAIVEHGYDGGWFTYTPESPTIAGPGWLYAFTIYLGPLVLVMATMDYGRLGRPADARFNGLVTFGPVFYGLIFFLHGLIGIFLVQTIPSGGVALSEASVVQGIVSLMGFAGVLLILVSQTRINTGNLYLSSSNLQRFVAQAFRIELPRTVWVAVAGLAGYLLMLTDVLSFVADALRYQGVVVVAWVGIVLVHLAYRRLRGLRPADVEFRPGRVPAVNPGGVGAWVIASGVGIYLLESSAVQPFGATWGPLVSFGLACVLYSASLVVARDEWFVLARPNDPRIELDDAWNSRVRCSFCTKSYVGLEMDRDPGNGLAPICAACATSPRFHRDARQDGRTFAAQPTAATATPQSTAQH